MEINVEFASLTETEQAERLAKVALAALDNWEGEVNSVSLIKYRENAVFDVRWKCGRRSALRVHRDGYHSDAQLRSELIWMEELRGSGIAAPRLIRPKCGSEFIKVAHDLVLGERQVDMLGWMDGQPVGAIEDCDTADIDELEPVYFQAGELAGRVHNHAASWRLPADFDRHAWDLQGLVGDEPLWGRFWELAALDENQRGLIQAARLRLAGDLEKFGTTADRFSLIHADLVPENIFRGEGGLQLIDFDDSGFGWHMFEIATALFFYVGRPDFPRIRDSMIAGYRTVRPLDETQVSALPMFLLLRSLTYLGWVHTRSETETARELTGMFVDISCDLARAYLGQPEACNA